MQWSKMAQSDRNSHSINGGGETWSFSVINYKFYQKSALLQNTLCKRRCFRNVLTNMTSVLKGKDSTKLRLQNTKQTEPQQVSPWNDRKL